MKRRSIFIACLLTVFLLASSACAQGTGGDTGFVESSLYPVVFFDDTGKNYVAAEDKTAQIVLSEGTSAASFSVRAENAAGETVAPEEVAVFDEETLTVTAVSEGTLYIGICGEDGSVRETVTVTSLGAYPSDPSFDGLRGSNGIIGSHDPSLIEAEGAYYSFSTGWRNGGNEIRCSEDLIHWELVGTTFGGLSGSAPGGNSWDEEYADVLAAVKADSLAEVDFWAPDIVAAPDGGYWLYSCAVGPNEGAYSRACIFLAHSDDLTSGSFSYEGMLFQSYLINGQGNQVNAIDPQIVYDAEGKMYMAYGSFNGGLYISELDASTGLKAAGMNRVYSDEEVVAFNDERKIAGSDGEKYCGTELSSGAMEAPVIARHDGVKIYNDDGTVKETVDSRYFFMASYGALATHYNMRYAISDGSVTGEYLDYAGNRLDSDNGYDGTGYKAMGAYRFVYNDGTSMSALDTRGDRPYNVYAPGHNDLFTTSGGTNVVARINRYYNDGENAFSGFSLFINQYYLNSQGQIVINPNRYAGEKLGKVTADDFMAISEGSFQGILMQETEDATSAPRISSAATFTKTGENGGAFTYGDMSGTWTIFGDYFIKLDAGEDGDVYYGVVSPAWIEGLNAAGLTVTAIGQETGMALWFNSDPTAA